MYILSEKYVRTPNTHDKKSTHVLVTAGNQSRVRAFIRRRDAPRPRLETIETGERNERTNERVRRRRRLRRDATANRTRARLIGVGKIHSLAARVTEKSTREDSFIHSFGSVTRAGDETTPPSLSIASMSSTATPLRWCSKSASSAISP